MRFIKHVFGYCYGCGEWFKYPKRYRMSTAYEDEEANYNEICKDCYEERETYWKERWNEYNSERL